jgi:hypothetical protein
MPIQSKWRNKVKRINQGPRRSSIRSAIQKNGVVTSTKKHVEMKGVKVSEQTLTNKTVQANQASPPEKPKGD